MIRMSETLYDISSLSETEIYDILDLSNPTDRELEAKILHMIWRYGSFGERGHHLVRFFEDIYDRFFEEPETSQEQEGFTMSEPTTDNILQTKSTEFVDNSSDDKNTEETKVQYNFPLDYTKDQLNPLLKSTTKRIISIDSQFRPTTDKVSQLATDFTFNLSTPLKDVVNLKMNSVQIPYTWYTINNNFGSNFFFLKGNVPGINNGNYDISFAIPSGNYNAADLVLKIQERITTSKQRTDISLGTTEITYNTADSKATFKWDIKNTYNENYYEMFFSSITEPSDKTSIPSFLGFNQQTHYPFRIYTQNLTNTQITTVDNNNNTMKIEYYTGNVIHNTIEIKIENGQFDLPIIASNINSALQNNPKLLGVSRFQIVSGKSYYEMDIRLNRLLVPIIPNAKMRVVFPSSDTNKLWYGTGSLLSFKSQIIEFGEIISENQVSNESIVIADNPYIIFDCSSAYYTSALNDISFVVPNNPAYTLKQYIDAINNSFVSSGQFNVGTTNFEIQSNQRLKITTDLTRKMLNTDYDLVIDAASIFKTVFKFSNCVIDTNPVKIIDSSFAAQQNYTLTPKFILLDARNGTASYNVDYDVLSSDTSTYSNLTSLETAINNVFANFKDPEGDNVLVNTSISFKLVPGNIVEVKLRIQIDKILRVNKYNMKFVDNSRLSTWNILDASNSWAYNLKIDREIIDLSAGYVGGKTDISFSDTIATDVISLSDASNNNKIYIRPINTDGENGVYTTNDGANARTIYFGNNVSLTRNAIFDIINREFALSGQTVDLTASNITTYTDDTISKDYTKISLYVNRTYTIKDYKLVFYDPFSFVSCSVGNSSVRNTTWDSTLGWILGFRGKTEYNFTNDTEDIRGDTVVSVNIYSYFMIVLEDYNLNRMTDGIVTTTQQSTDIALPSYANRTMIECDPSSSGRSITTSVMTNTGRKNLTQKQVEAVGANLTKSGIKKYTAGSFTKDVLAIIPLKLTGLPNNSMYVINGSDLVGQERSYFGPVNLQRMTVKLVNDKGETVDLNGADWSMTLLCEQMYNQK